MAKASATKRGKTKAKASRTRAKMPTRKKAGKKTKAKKTKAKKTKAKKTKAKKLTKKVTKKVAGKKKKAAKKTSAKRKTSPKATRALKPETQAPMMPESYTPPSETTSFERVTLNVGDMAPDFNLPDQNGQFHSLQQYAGKNVVLYFYPKDDTPGCTKEACSFRDNLQSFADRNTVVLGISLDDTDSHRKFVEKYDLNFSLLSDTEKEVAQAYGVYGPKNMYGKTYMGVDRSTFIIDGEGRIAAIFKSVKVDGHTDEVTAEIEKLS